MWLSGLARHLRRFVATPPSTARGRAILLAICTFGATGCAKEIGDACTVNADCNGSTSDRICDTTQPSGYCTVFSCSRGTCPSEARCVAYGTSIPGCGYDDRRLPRTARSFCLKECEGNSDCRDGYVCEDPTKAPWNAVVLDDGRPRVCVVAASFEFDNVKTPTAPRDPDAGVCLADEGRYDAGSFDAGAKDAGASDAGAADAGSAQDGAVDSGL
jgi:hypothetical protein